MQALSLRMPQNVLMLNVIMRFWRGMGTSGMMEEWSVRLLTVQVIRQTKYIHLNLQEVMKSRGEATSLIIPLLTPSLTVCLPFAYSITERSKIALVGETAKPVTIPAIMSFTESKLERGLLITFCVVVKIKNYLIQLKSNIDLTPKQLSSSLHASQAGIRLIQGRTGSYQPIFCLTFIIENYLIFVQIRSNQRESFLASIIKLKYENSLGLCQINYVDWDSMPKMLLNHFYAQQLRYLILLLYKGHQTAVSRNIYQK